MKNLKIKEYVINVKINIIHKNAIKYILKYQIVNYIQMKNFQHVNNVMKVIFYFNYRINVNNLNK